MKLLIITQSLLLMLYLLGTLPLAWRQLRAAWKDLRDPAPPDLSKVETVVLESEIARRHRR